MRIKIEAFWMIVVERKDDFDYESFEVVEYYAITKDERIYTNKITPKDKHQYLAWMKKTGSINPDKWFDRGIRETPSNHRHSGIPGSPD